MIRLLVVVGVVAVVALATLWHRRRSSADEARGGTGLAPLPSELRSEGLTWVVFTTPYCASCGAVERDLGEAFPHHTVIKVDATERPELADAYEILRAPTTLLGGPDGTVLQRLVGAESVRDFIGTTDDPALVD